MRKILYTLPIGFIIACGAAGTNTGEFPDDLNPDSSVDTPWGSFYFGDPGPGICTCRKPGDIQLKSLRPDNACVCFVPNDETPDGSDDAFVDTNTDSTTPNDGGYTTDAHTYPDGNSDSSSDGSDDGSTDSSTGGYTVDASTTGGTTGVNTTGGTTGSNTTGGTTGSSTGGNTTGGTTGQSTGSTGGSTTSDGGTCGSCPTPVPCNQFGFNCNECYVFSYCTVDGKYEEQIACKSEVKTYDEQCTRNSSWDYTQGGYRWHVYLCSK